MMRTDILPILPVNGFVLSAEILASLVDTDDIDDNDYKKFPSKEPSAFITGLAYYAGTVPLAPEALENIPVGIQEHAITVGSITITNEIIEAEGHPSSPALDSIDTINDDNNSEALTETDAQIVAKKLQKQPAKQIAVDAARKRVSRRLLMTERSKHTTVACPITGIVSILEIPNIPFPQKNPQLAKALIWTSPFGSLDNCRGLAQQGLHYLRKLDTQILAGILIAIAEHYELFKFQPFDSASQKNAILRTAGKDAIIDAVILIEEMVHSGNHRFLPKLSLVYDEITEREGLEVRMQSYLKILADAIALPDKEAYDDKKILPMYPIRPAYIRDAEIAVKKAKKEFAEDIKAGKIAIGFLQKQVLLSPKMREFLGALFNGDGMLVMPAVIVDKIIDKLETYGNGNADQLIGFLKKDRKALRLDLSELAEEIEETSEADDPAPGQESEEAVEVEDTCSLTATDTANDEDTNNNQEFQDTEGDAYEQDMLKEQDEQQSLQNNQDATSNTMDASEDSSICNGNSLGNCNANCVTGQTGVEEQQDEEEALAPPAGLSTWDKILWKKKMNKAVAQKRNIVVNDIPSTTSYVPSINKQRLGE